ncbi:MAG TPA: CehA/McbA family metallohydrolase [Solirubrobacteraceae bacterium]|nr:CehA/McbA family metallohydrolase [Solirubrobacteraceae bacterium]
MPSRDLACVIHCHSTYSDGTGTVAQIAAAASRAGVDAVLLTDHDTLAARRSGEERWYGDALVCVGVEVSPPQENHFLAFGLEREIDHSGLSPAEIVAAVGAGGGFGFLAHPFSRGSERFSRARGMPWRDLDAPGFTGIELWSLITDTGESLRSLADAARFIAAPLSMVDRPPQRNLDEWDRLCGGRPVVAIGGVDAHQIGYRIGNRVPLRLMAYHRSFAHLRTHVMLERPPSGDAGSDRDAIYAALRQGRCYLALDSVAPARGFGFTAVGGDSPLPMGSETVFDDRLELRVSAPRPARIGLLRDGAEVASAFGTRLDHRPQRPGVYRVEVTLALHDRPRAWILSNPIYLRA